MILPFHLQNENFLQWIKYYFHHIASFPSPPTPFYNLQLISFVNSHHQNIQMSYCTLEQYFQRVKDTSLGSAGYGGYRLKNYYGDLLPYSYVTLPTTNLLRLNQMQNKTLRVLEWILFFKAKIEGIFAQKNHYIQIIIKCLSIPSEALSDY